MEYRDKKYGFSFDVPNGWEKTGKLYCFFRNKRVVLFPKTTPNSILSLENTQDNMLYSFMQSGYEAGISIVCCSTDPID